MAPFRFRAAAALDLWRKEEDAARLVHAAAERVARAADASVVEARGALDGASEARMAIERAGAEAGLIVWHRTWTTRLRLDVDARQRAAAVSAADLERATTSMRKAHQRRRTLERLRERGVRRYDAEVLRVELKEMNLLAGLRFGTKTTNQGETE